MRIIISASIGAGSWGVIRLIGDVSILILSIFFTTTSFAWWTLLKDYEVAYIERGTKKGRMRLGLVKSGNFSMGWLLLGGLSLLWGMSITMMSAPGKVTSAVAIVEGSMFFGVVLTLAAVIGLLKFLWWIIRGGRNEY